MTSKLISVATLFATGSILVAGTPTLGATSLDTQAAATQDLRCGSGGGGGRRCGGGGGGGRRCGGGIPRCGGGIPRCGHWCAVRTCASRPAK